MHPVCDFFGREEEGFVPQNPPLELCPGARLTIFISLGEPAPQLPPRSCPGHRFPIIFSVGGSALLPSLRRDLDPDTVVLEFPPQNPTRVSTPNPVLKFFFSAGVPRLVLLAQLIGEEQL